MTSRDGALERARRRAERDRRQLCYDLREARLNLGLSQRQVAAAAGISRSSLERLELGQLPNLSLWVASQVAAAVGLDLVIRTYPGGSRLRDAGQLRLLQRLRARMGAGWRWTYEASLASTGDQRAWDARATHIETGVTVVIEAETRIRDVQAVLRRVAGKRRDDGAPRVILLVAGTRSNRLMLREAVEPFTAVFPVRTRVALMALAAGRCPQSDARIIL